MDKPNTDPRDRWHNQPTLTDLETAELMRELERERAQARRRVTLREIEVVS